MTSHIHVRYELPADLPAIREVTRRAFGRDAEADLIDRLRSDGDIVASMVADEDGRIIGHVLFSSLPIATAGGELSGVAMGPVSVLPERQGQGVGARIVDRGIATCRALGYEVAVVLGYPDYYSRLGFSAELARQLHGPFAGEAFMALELVPGVMAGTSGSVQYPAAFLSAARA